MFLSPDVPRVRLFIRDDFYPRRVELNEGDEAFELICEAEANPEAHSIHWKKDVSVQDHSRLRDELLEHIFSILFFQGQILTPESLVDLESTSSFDGEARSVLRLTHLTPEMTGNYSCTAENLVGQGSSETKMQILVKCENIINPVVS